MNGENSATKKGVGIAVFVFAIAVPWIVKIYLNAPISIVVLFLLVASVAVLGYLRRIHATEYPWLPYLSAAVTTAIAILVLVGILITPLSAYNSWFESYKYGTPEGGVSNLFVLVTAFFSSVLGPMMVSMGVLWPLILVGFVLLYLLAIIVQSQLLLVLLLAFLIVPSVYVAFRSVSRLRRENALVFMMAVIGVSFVIAVIVPKFENPPGDDYVNDTLHPRLRASVVSFFPRFPLLYSVPGYGISFDEKQLGGRPNLQPNPIFLVDGEPGEAVYLRTRIFDTYDGSSWAMSPYFAGRSTDAIRSQYFGSIDDISDDDLRIELSAKSFGFVPYTIDTDAIIVERGLPRLTEGSFDTGYRLQSPLKKGDVVYLQREAETGGVPDPIHEAESRLYTQIPVDLPPELRIIAEGLSRNADSGKQVLANIEGFLAQNYTYNLEVESLPDVYIDTDDFVYSFLFSEAGGYCVQFATSFIILARLNGIPARYATGYLAYVPSDGSTAQVTGLSAHAWPEVWVEGDGWINWEATPAANIANYSLLEGDWLFNYGVDLNATTSRQLENLLGRNFDESLGDGENRSPWRWLRFALITFGGLAGAAGIAFVVIKGVGSVKYLIRDDLGRFYHRTKRLSKRLNRLGVPAPERVGWIAWFSNIELRIDGAGSGLDSMRTLMMKVTYSDESATTDLVPSINAFSRQIVHRVKAANRN